MVPIRWLERALQRVLVLLTSLLAVAIAVILLLQVVSRMILHYPFAWPEEVAGFLFTWLIFLGVSVAYRSGTMIGIDWLVQMAPQRVRGYVHLASSLVVILTLAFLIWKGIDATLAAQSSKTTVLRFSWAWVYVSFPVGFALLLFSFLLDFLSDPTADRGGLAGAVTAVADAPAEKRDRS